VADLFMAWSTPIAGDLEQALQFDQAFADGSALSQQEAVATARAAPTAAALPAAGKPLYQLREIGLARLSIRPCPPLS
jgi:hypothetical protein